MRDPCASYTTHCGEARGACAGSWISNEVRRVALVGLLGLSHLMRLRGGVTSSAAVAIDDTGQNLVGAGGVVSRLMVRSARVLDQECRSGSRIGGRGCGSHFAQLPSCSCRRSSAWCMKVLSSYVPRVVVGDIHWPGFLSTHRGLGGLEVV